MRPSILYPLFASLETVSGVGTRLKELLEKLVGSRVIDLLWHFPNGLIDRRVVCKIEEAQHDKIATLVVRVDGHAPALRKTQPYKIRCLDETGLIEITYFHAKGDYLEKLYPVGKKIVISGRVQKIEFQSPTMNTPMTKVQMAHPDMVGAVEDLAKIATIEPTYALTAGLSTKGLKKILSSILQKVPDLPEWLDPLIQQKKQFLSWKEALKSVHSPEKESDLLPTHPARMRFAYDELLANQLALLLVRQHQKQELGRSINGNGQLRLKTLKALPYKLTPCQERALQDIYADMGSEDRMLRLIQGDVGSGKTIVGFLAMLNAVEAGFQAALMVPTEILARQHMETIAPLAEKIGCQVVLLTGREKGKIKEELLETIASGKASIVIGTHALFQEKVIFKNLGLAIVDEQHRFGVHQRLQFSAKGLDQEGKVADLLVMTATPIPRTLALTYYGDMDISSLPEKPPGRSPIDTRLIPLDRLEEVVTAIKRKIQEGEKIYWVCPLVDESEIIDLAAATERYAFLKALLGDNIGLVHGGMKGLEKDNVMSRFSTGGLSVLVATTVIEVGVNVPEATVMVIEHAERFGLSQLHQLRGRVGRGTKPASCLLLYTTKIGETAKSRLKIMRETQDGFRIAEEDLRLRGSGEFLGTKQSGLPEFRIADLNFHQELLIMTRDEAKFILQKDPKLLTERGKALRVLLYLFERDTAIKYLQSG